MNSIYQRGVADALAELGLKHAEYDEEEQGTPYPQKNLSINAERLAKQLREGAADEDVDKNIDPENASNTWDRPVTWQSPMNLSDYEAGGITIPGGI